MNRDNKGFSLVELLVVIAVMAILAGVGLQGFGLVANGNMKRQQGFSMKSCGPSRKIPKISMRIITGS